jgi:beta-glucoside operon transcriptional antiterminator
MRVVKVLNNSLVLALDADGQQVILMGKGVGFHRSVGDFLKPGEIEQVYVLRDRQLERNIIRLAKDVDAVYFDIARSLIEYARQKYGLKLMDTLYLSLTDHLSYAVQRTKEGIQFENFYALDARKFNPREFEIGLKALDLIEKRTGVRLPDDEAGSVAFHFINAEQEDASSGEGRTIAETVTDILNIIKYTFSLEFNKESTAYARCVTHLRLFVHRLIHDEMMPDESDNLLYQEIVSSCPDEWNCVLRIGTYISGKFHALMTTQEELYLVLHIHRVIGAIGRS